MDVDPYIDPATGLLLNRLGITNADQLRRAEANLSQAALSELGLRIVPGLYDLEHLRAFHRAIFEDIYPWAGEIRTVGIAKTAPFCLPQHIETYSADVFGSLAKEKFLRGLIRGRFVDRLTHYLADVNAIHPFREGNGRTQRAFFRQLAKEAGWSLNWSTLNQADNVQASAASLRGDNRLLRELLDSVVQ